MIKVVSIIHFKSVQDFRNRIARLWQYQKENEEYEFTFETEEVENAFDKFIDKLIDVDNKGQV